VKKTLEVREKNVDEDTGLRSLKKIAEFRTKRESWDIDGFKVVIDRADFGHRVGGVELCGEVGEDSKKAGVEMDRRIEEFMKEHAWAFPVGKAMGKLSAYWLSKTQRELGLAYPVLDLA
jgi:thiamine-triphosphatase